MIVSAQIIASLTLECLRDNSFPRLKIGKTDDRDRADLQKSCKLVGVLVAFNERKSGEREKRETRMRAKERKKGDRGFAGANRGAR